MPHTTMLEEPSLAEIDAGPLANERTSVFWHIEQGLHQGPQKPAVVCMHQPPNHLSDWVPSDNESGQQNSRRDCLTLTYLQLHGAAMTVVAGMMAQGVRPGTRILTLIPNGGEYTILLWACTLLRLTFTSLDPSLLDDAASRTELRDLMTNDLQPGIVVVADSVGALVLDELIRGTEPPLRISLSSDNFPDGWLSLATLVAGGRSHPSSFDEEGLCQAARKDDPERIHSILFTSGTSNGRPKGCPQRVASMTHVLEHLSWLITRDNSTSVLQQAHNSRAIAPAHTLQTWRQGGTVVMAQASFAVEDTLTAILHHEVTFIVLSPAMVHALAREMDGDRKEKHSVRTIHLGGDAITKDVLMKAAALFPTAKVCISHGMTEGLGFFEWPFRDTKSVADIPLFGEICPTGAVAAGSRLRIWDADRHTVAARGQPGELHVCCDSVIRHYLGGGTGPSPSFHEDDNGRRWFVTGDVGMMDARGLVFILGRSKDMIKRAGVPIVPAALESCLEKYTAGQVSFHHFIFIVSLAIILSETDCAAAQAAVVAVPHPTLGHEPIAVLDDMNEKSEDQIRDHVTGLLGPEYALGRVLSLHQIGLSKFPVNTTHKVVRFDVQRAVIEYLDQI